MVAHHAAILDHDLSRGAGLLRRAFVPDSKLHPDHLPGTFDRLIDDRKDVGRRTKDVDRVVGDRHSIEGRIGLLSKDLRGGRVHRDDPVSVHLHVLRDSVGVLRRILRTTDHGNRPDALEDLSDLGVFRHISRPSGRRKASRLRFRREHPADRLLQRRGDVQRHRFVRREPAGLGVFFVRDPGLALPACDQEEIMPKEVARGRIDVLVDSEELRLDRSDPELLLELSDQGARRILAWHQVASEGIPHARKTDGAGPLPQEHPPTLHDEARRRDMDHTGAKARRGYASFGSARFANPKLLSLNNDNTEGRGNLTALSIRVPLPKIQAAVVRWTDRWMRSPRRLRSDLLRFAEAQDRILILNPHLEGAGSDVASGAGCAYAVAKALDPANKDLASVAIVGAVGDVQDQEFRRLSGYNREILQDGIDAGVLRAQIDLRLFGRETRPAYKLLQCATDPWIQPLSGNEDACIAFLLELGVDLKVEEHWRSWSDLELGERRR